MPGCNRTIIDPIPERAPVEAVIAAVADLREPAILDSADSGPGRGRYSILAFDPVETVSWPGAPADPFTGMGQRLAEAVPPPPGSPPFEFCGGWIGYFAYEAGRCLESLPQTTSDDVGMPIARFSLYDTAAVCDVWTGQWFLVGVEDRRTESPLARRFAAWRELIRSARLPDRRAGRPAAPAGTNMSHSQYLRMIERARDYIAAGDIFQVNLARRETFVLSDRPISVYLRLRELNPAAYAAYLGRPEGAILSASPELFLHLRDRHVLTRPIKGTRPRSADPARDAALRCELLASGKDRAELAMIVDLERNDLGRVCQFGSVRVGAGAEPSPFSLETYPTVHHLVADVTGTLRDGLGAIDLLRATFPGGSITGAPKIRAMQIIDELEPTVRSIYTGAIGYFSLNGSAMFNIAIRTILVRGTDAFVYAGGGIVADSRPQDEYDETIAKALALRRALGV